jgi:hypothetical protein
VSSDFVVEEMIQELRDAGRTLRAIAARVGLSRSRVHQIVSAGRPRQEALPLDVDDGSPPVGSVRFVGFDEIGRRVELFADEAGRRFNLLELYRHTRVDGGVLFRDACKQLEAVGRWPRGEKTGWSEDW